MAKCTKALKLTAKEEKVFKGCEKKHSFGVDNDFKCGIDYDFPTCKENHVWECDDCLNKITPGKTLPRTPMMKKPETCKNNIEVKDSASDFFPPTCLAMHTFGPGTYICGTYMVFSDCQNEHFIKCSQCRGKSLPLPSATSTPAPKTTNNEKDENTKKVPFEETLKMQEELHESVIEALQDNNDEAGENCEDRNHLFEIRTKKHLSAPARTFYKIIRSCHYHFSKNYMEQPISKKWGKELIENLGKAFKDLEIAREYCLQPLDPDEKLEKQSYIEERFDEYNECLQLYDHFFNAITIEQEIVEATTPKRHHIQQKSEQNSIAPPLSTRHSIAPPLQNRSPYQLRVPRPTGQQFNQVPQSQIQINTQSMSRQYFKLKDELSLIKKFDGQDQRKYMAFHAQWKNYIIKANQMNRSQLDLYHDLLSRLEAPAYDLCSTDYPSQDSYAAAIQTLDERYYNPSHLLRDMVKRTTKMTKMTDTYQSLLDASINLKKAKADLCQANLSTEQLQGLFLISSTEKHLSESAWTCWNEVQNSQQFRADPMACFDIDNFLWAINQAMTNIHRKENAIGYNKPEANKFKPKSTLYGSYTTRVEKEAGTTPNYQKQAKKNGKCIFCSKGPHRFQLYCGELKNKAPEQIRKIMQEHSIECAMCLCPSHLTRDCIVTNNKKLRPCDVIEAGVPCKKFHCRYLHRKNYRRPNTNFTTTVKAEPTSDTTKLAS